MFKKPKLGQRVFCIYQSEGILADNVMYLGKDSFIIDRLHDNRMKSDTWEWTYDTYGELWFTTLKEVKEAVGEDFKSFCNQLKQMIDECYTNTN